MFWFTMRFFSLRSFTSPKTGDPTITMRTPFGNFKPTLAMIALTSIVTCSLSNTIPLKSMSTEAKTPLTEHCSKLALSTFSFTEFRKPLYTFWLDVFRRTFSDLIRSGLCLLTKRFKPKRINKPGQKYIMIWSKVKCK